MLRPGASAAEVIFDANPQIDEWRLGPQRVVRWQNARNETIEGILVLPPGLSPGSPCSSDRRSVRPPVERVRRILMLANRYLAAQGYALFYQTIARSTRFRNRFWASSTRRVSQREDSAAIMTDDILSGVDHLIAQGIVDPESLRAVQLLDRRERDQSFDHENHSLSGGDFSGGRCGLGEYYASRPPIDQNHPKHARRPQAVRCTGFIRIALRDRRCGSNQTPLLLATGEKENFFQQNILFAQTLDRLKKPVKLFRYPDQGHGFQGERSAGALEARASIPQEQRDVNALHRCVEKAPEIRLGDPRLARREHCSTCPPSSTVPSDPPG